MYIYLNGQFFSEAEAKISPFDHGFLYGLGVFETLRIYNGHPFLLDDHFQRLKSSAQQLAIHLELKKEQLYKIISQLLVRNKLSNAYVRVNVSAGVAPIGLKTDAYTKPTIIVFIKPLEASMPQEKLAAFLNIPRNTPEGKERVKSHHYLNNVLAKQEITDRYTEGIFLTKEGYIAEGIVSNLFWVREGQVFTPAVETGILNGITRQFVIKLLDRQGIKCSEGFYLSEDVFSAEEVFLTNSIQEIVAVSAINDYKYDKARPIIKLLQTMYQEYKDQHLLSMDEMKEGL